eukprot:s7216_g3.t1
MKFSFEAHLDVDGLKSVEKGDRRDAVLQVVQLSRMQNGLVDGQAPLVWTEELKCLESLQLAATLPRTSSSAFSSCRSGTSSSVPTTAITFQSMAAHLGPEMAGKDFSVASASQTGETQA